MQPQSDPLQQDPGHQPTHSLINLPVHLPRSEPRGGRGRPRRADTWPRAFCQPEKGWTMESEGSKEGSQGDTNNPCGLRGCLSACTGSVSAAERLLQFRVHKKQGR